ncbi:MAG: hypothetical protein KAU28_11090 [Phycisphaerae bacterium]|nr:hypothetical protein [Phycisphaerae bacterium]
MKTQWIAVAAAAAVLLIAAGCDGTGGVGGQGICLKDNSDCTVTITITDGGTGLGNPLPAAGPETETTPPVKSVSEKPSPAAP